MEQENNMGLDKACKTRKIFSQGFYAVNLFYLDFARKWEGLYGPQRDKTCIQGFPQSEIKTSLLSYRD